MSSTHPVPGGSPSARREDIAIIGMACLFPGASTPRAFWENIVGKVDAVGEPPPGWGAEHYLDPASDAADRLYCVRGGYLGDLAQFEPHKFGVMPSSVAGGDPGQFLALRVAHEAFADAGCLERPIDRSRVEVILGQGMYVQHGYAHQLQHGLVIDQTLQILKALHPEHTDEELASLKRELQKGLAPFTAEGVPAHVPNVTTGRICNRLDLMGANYLVDAACASSLVALELGMRSLLMEKSDLVLVGGSNASIAPMTLMLFCQLGALSRRGQIRPFDKDADGVLLGEGLGAVVLKRIGDAERDGDRIYAVLRGVGTASDGRALGLLAPRVEGEELALRRAYDVAGVSPRTVELVEAHGTGMPLGDETEVQALQRVFGVRDGVAPWCALGSVKSMISHLIPAAGIAGVIKAALSLYHKVLPPTLHCEAVNPKLGLDETPFYINTETRPWIHGGAEPRRAGVNAFGFGGINAHAILEEYTGAAEETLPSFLHRWDSEVIVLGGASRRVLMDAGERLAGCLTANPQVSLKDVAFTLNCPMPDGPLRLAIVAQGVEDLTRKLQHALRRLADPACRRIRDRSGLFFFETPLGASGGLAFLFPGEGSQYAGMLGDLCIHFPEIRLPFDALERSLRASGAEMRLGSLLFPPPLAPRPASGASLGETDLGIVSVFAGSRGLLSLLTTLGLRPDAVAGHSMGEYVALLASGALALRNDVEIARFLMDLHRAYRAVLDDVPATQFLTVGGVASSVVEAAIAQGHGAVRVAMDNCPHQVIICGSPEAIVTAREELQSRGAICGLLPFDRAYHTPDFRSVSDRMIQHYADLPFATPGTPVFSCATAQPYPAAPAAIRGLLADQWASPVRFRETVQAMYDAGIRCFVEIGPRANLTNFVEDTLADRPILAVASNLPDRSGISQLNTLVALLASHGLPLRLDRLYERRDPRRLSFEDGTAQSRRSAGGPGPLRLTLELPRLRVPAQSGPARSDPTPARTPREEASEPPSPAEKDSTGSRTQDHQARPSTPAVAPADSPPAFPSRRERAPHGVRTVRPRDGILASYFQTMEEFLRVQQQVAKGYFRARQARSGASSRIRVGNVSPPAGPLAGSPFALGVTSSVTDREVRGTWHLDIERDIFLRDHTLSRTSSAGDSTLLGLPVVPLTFSLEVMAEVATLLCPGKRVVGMRDVRSHRWIALEETRRLLAFAARRVPDGSGDEVVVELLEEESESGAAPGARSLVVEGIVRFGDAWPAAPSAMPFRDQRTRPYRHPSAAYYGELVFLGSAFRSVASIDWVTDDSLQATLVSPPPGRLFNAVECPAFLLDPILLDGAGQIPGFFAIEDPQAPLVFPTALAALEVFGPSPSGPVTCRARVQRQPDGRFRSDIDLLGPGGRLWARLLGWEDVPQRDWGRGFGPYRFLRDDSLSSQPWPGPLAVMSNARAWRCRRATAAGSGIWSRVVAHAILGRRERETWRKLVQPELRRREWLLGRLAAKDAVRVLLRDRHGIEVAPADLEIIPDGRGRPEVRGRALEGLGVRPAVSIAHTGGGAVAVAAEVPSANGIGIDVEALDPRRADIADIAFTPEERALLSGVPAADRSEWTLRAWCAKEAIGKALGRGLEGSPLSLVVRRFDPTTGEVVVEAAGAPAEAFGDAAGRPLRAQTGREGAFVFAIAVA